FVISVPNDSSTYSLTALISTQITYSYPVSPVYEQKINKAVANGYASLNASALVPLAQLGPGAANGYVLTTDGSAPAWQPPPLPSPLITPAPSNGTSRPPRLADATAPPSRGSMTSPTVLRSRRRTAPAPTPPSTPQSARTFR